MDLYLITGGAGFIGSNLALELYKMGEKVRILDNFSTGKKENLEELLHADSSRFELIEGNICNLETCQFACKDVDYVLHHAALGSVYRSIDNPLETNEVNVKGTLNMLVASKEARVKRFIYASSSSVYGDLTSPSGEMIKKDEKMIPQPKSPYAVSKLAGEYYAQVFYKLYGLKTIIFRYFNVFGERQDFDSIYSAVIPKFIKALLSGEPPVIYGDGEQSRDFTYVKNVIQANLKACKAPESVAGEVMNIASGKNISINQLYQSLSSLIPPKIEPQHASPRPGEVRHSLADITKARKLIGYNPESDSEEGLLKTIAWFKSALFKEKGSTNHLAF